MPKPKREIDHSSKNRDYQKFLTDVKRRIDKARYKALSTASRELVNLYRFVGQGITYRQKQQGWGTATVEELSKDLRSSYPEMKGFSVQNLWYMRQFYIAYRNNKKLQTASGEIGWSHNILILSQCEELLEREFYLGIASRERWSYRELKRQIDSDLYTRYALTAKHKPGKTLHKHSKKGNFLPFKDNYILEFLDLEDHYTEGQFRKAILSNLKNFFLEFGYGFTFIGEEHPLTVDGDVFRVDLLFYHRELQCLIAVELKIGSFRPEYVGKMQFYLQSLDEQEKKKNENPSIGLILCKTKKSEQVRIALTQAARKIGVATYQTKLPGRKLLLKKLHQMQLSDN